MRNTTIYMVMGLAGMAFCIVLGYMNGGEFGAVSGMMGGILCFIPTIQLILQAKQKGFLALYWNLEEENSIKKEKYLMVPNKFGKLQVMVAKMVKDGVIFVKRWGPIDDKGTEYSFGNSPLSFVIPHLAFTKNLMSSQYHHLLKKEQGVNDWDEAVKKYLGPERYKEFCVKFRKEDEPDSDAIQAELQWLKDVKDPVDPLSISVVGETMTFHDDIDFFKYNYLPEYMNVYVEQEKINVRREEQGYKDPGKAMAWGKAAFIVILAVIIAIVVLSSVDLSQIAGFFGGGSHAVTPPVNGTVSP